MPNTYLDGVRAGIVLYGYYPSEDVLKQNLDLKKAITIKTSWRITTRGRRCGEGTNQKFL